MESMKVGRRYSGPQRSRIFFVIIGSENLTRHSEVFRMFVFCCENSEAFFIYSEAFRLERNRA